MRMGQQAVVRAVPERVHTVITEAMRRMTEAVIAGSGFTTASPEDRGSLESIEAQVRRRIGFYQNASAAEGAVTGAGGILMGLADLPLWLTLKMKMLFEIASLYGHDTAMQEERVFILTVFELVFSHPERRRHVLSVIGSWGEGDAPRSIAEYDWRTFQQEYRDSIDLPKLLQLVPGIGAPVGAIVNHVLTKKLGRYAMNAYRIRRGLHRFP